MSKSIGMLSTKSIIKVLCLCLLTSGCSLFANDEEEQMVAQVYDYTLYQSDLEGLVPNGISSEDSMSIVDNYVDQWIRQMVILAKAEKNVKDDLSKQLNEYRNSLLTYAYEQQMVDQMLDTNISEEQIQKYYNEHSGDFLLKSAIVKAVYVKAPKNSSHLQRLRTLVSKSPFDDKDVVELEQHATKHGFTGYYDATTWIPFYNLQTSVPITTYNEGLYLKQNRTIQLSDDSLSYFVRILDYKVSDEISPLEVQHENIRSILLNHRKLEILNKLQSDLLKKAEAGGHIKRNNKKE